MTRFGVRAHYWGALLVVVPIGDIDVGAADELASGLATLSLTTDLMIDLVDVTSLDAAGVAALVTAKRSAEKDGWGFALVANPDGPCTEAIRAAGQMDTLKPFPDRHAARAALQA